MMSPCPPYAACSSFPFKLVLSAAVAAVLSACQSFPVYAPASLHPRSVVLDQDQHAAMADIDWGEARHAAFAINPDGKWALVRNQPTVARAEREALARCNNGLETGNLMCKLHTVDGQTVLSSPATFQAASGDYQLVNMDTVLRRFDIVQLDFEGDVTAWDTEFPANNTSTGYPRAQVKMNTKLRDALVGDTIAMNNQMIFFESADIVSRHVKNQGWNIVTRAEEWYVTPGGIVCWGNEFDDATDMLADTGTCYRIKSMRGGALELMNPDHTSAGRGVLVKGDARYGQVW